MKNFIQNGDVLIFTTSDPVLPGQGVQMGALFGVAATASYDGEPFAASVTGVFELPKTVGAIAAGAKAYWNAAVGAVTTTASGNMLIGAATEDAADAATAVRVRLNGGV